EGRDRPDGLPRPGAGRERPAGHHDVRDPLERRHPGAVPRALRRLLDRLERHDTADARPGPGLGPGRRRLRRAGPGGEVHALSRDRGLPRGREVRGHLRAGPLGPSRPGPVAAGQGHRLDVPEPGHRRGHLAAAGEAGLIGGRAERRQARSSSSITGISPVRVEWLPPLGWEVTVVSTKAQSSSASTAWRKWVRASRSPARSSDSSCPVTRRLPRTTWIDAAGGELCSGSRSPRRRAMTLWRSGPSLTSSSAWRPFSAVRAWFMAWVIASGRAGMDSSSEAASVPIQYRPEGGEGAVEPEKPRAAAGAVPGGKPWRPVVCRRLRRPTIAGGVCSTGCDLRRYLARSVHEDDILRVLRSARRRGTGELGGEEGASLGLPAPGGEPTLPG